MHKDNFSSAPEWVFVVSRLKLEEDQLKCYEDLDLWKIISEERVNHNPSPVTKVYQSDASEGIEEYLAWRWHYGATDESEDEDHEVPTITFTDDINSITELEVGTDECKAHIPP